MLPRTSSDYQTERMAKLAAEFLPPPHIRLTCPLFLNHS